MRAYAVYVVEFYVPRSRSAQVRELAQQVAGAAGERPMRCLHVLAVPDEEYCLCVYEAESARIVQDAIRAAGLEPEAVAVPALLHTDLLPTAAANTSADPTRYTAPPSALA